MKPISSKFVSTLNKLTIESMIKFKNETFPINYSLSFDTMFTSYLKEVNTKKISITEIFLHFLSKII